MCRHSSQRLWVPKSDAAEHRHHPGKLQTSFSTPAPASPHTPFQFISTRALLSAVPPVGTMHFQCHWFTGSPSFLVHIPKGMLFSAETQEHRSPVPVCADAAFSTFRGKAVLASASCASLHVPLALGSSTSPVLERQVCCSQTNKAAAQFSIYI